MRGIECVGDLNSERQQYFCFQGAPGNAVLQRRALQVLHNEKGTALLLADVINRADVRVIQGGCSSRLPLETAERLAISSYIVG